MRVTQIQKIGMGCLISIFMILVAGFSTVAADLTVTTLEDELNSDGDCSLREAIEAANTDTAVDTCGSGSGDDTIGFASGLSGTITLNGSQLIINSNVTMNGPGADDLAISGNNASRVVLIDGTPETVVVISGVSIVDGEASDDNGGGVHNRYAQITLDRVTVSNNQTTKEQFPFWGGGIYNLQGTMTVTNSTVSANQTLPDSRSYGGGFYNSRGMLTLKNSTVSGNLASSGSGIWSVGPLTLEQCTITGNTADSSRSGTAIIAYPYDGVLNVSNTIIAGNHGSGENKDCVLIGNSMGIDRGNLIVSHSTCGTPVSTADPLLGPLQDNGGSTWTHALLAGSPAIDAGDPDACLATDQRGLPRPVDGDGDETAVCDIGAVEYQSEPQSYQLTVTKQGTGDGTVIGDGIDCGGDCTETYPDGTILDLQAIPYAGSEFVGWLVNDEPPQGGEIVINGDITLTAIFDQKQSGVALEFCGQSPNPQAIPYESGKRVLRSPNGEVVASLFWDDGKRMLALMSGLTFEVQPHQISYQTLVSNDAQTIVLVGGEECLDYLLDPMCPYADLFFYNASGHLQKEVLGVHKFSIVAISEDGYLVVGGPLRDSVLPNERFVTLYDPLGNKVWSQSIGVVDRVTDISISPSAATITVAYEYQEGSERIDRPHHVLLFDKDGTEVFRYENVKSVHHILFCEQDQYLVLQTFDTFSLRKLSSGEPSWIISKKYRMVGPHAIQIFEDRNIVVLVALDFSDPVSSEQPLYRWHVHLLNLTTGDELFVVDLPGLHSGYGGRVIVPEDDHAFSIATREELFCFRFTMQ